MDAQDFRRIQEAYREVYQELDEVLDTPQKTQSYAAKNAASAVGAFVRGDAKTLSKRFEGAKRGMKKIEKRKEQREEVVIDEADDLESLQKDTQSSVDRMKKGNRITRAGAHIAAHKVARDVKKASAYGPQRPKAGQTGAYRIGEEVGIDEAKWIQKAIKKPGSLHKQLGVPAGEKIPAKELAAAAKKGGKLGKRARLAQTLKSLNKEEYDFILSHLIDEGYTNTFDGARVIASNMSDDWIVSILDEEITPERRAQYKRGLKVRQTNQETAGKSRPRKRATSPQPGAQHQRKGMTQSHRDTMRDVAREENPERPEGSGSLPKGKKLERQRKTGVSAE